MRELVARRVPLYRFVLGNVLSRYDLDRADGRVDALREAARLVSSVRDKSKVDAFAREMAVDDRRRGRRGPGRGTPCGRSRPPPARPRARVARPVTEEVAQQPSRNRPTPPGPPRPAVRARARDPQARAARTRPRSAAPPATSTPTTSPTRRTARSGSVIAGPAAPEVGVDGPGLGRRGCATTPRTRRSSSALSALAVEPLLSAKEPDTAYVDAHVYRLQELTVLRRITDLKSKLQRTNPVEHPADYNRMFGELVALEQHRRSLRELAMGSA